MKVICPEHVRTIRLDAEWRPEVSVQQTLVFLDVRGRWALHDACTVNAGVELDSFAWRSPDALVTGQRKRGDTIVIDWRPRERVVPFALYDHQYSWNPDGSYGEPAVCVDLRCDMKTGRFRCDIIGPDEFESAVVFEPPRWRSINTERRLIKHALKQMDVQDARPKIEDGGRRVTWEMMGPKVGARFMLVAFRRYGVALWQDRIEKESLSGRARQLFGRLAST
jgi:hypothetical protein